MQCMLKDRQANEPCSHTECWDAAYRMLPVTHLHNLQMIKHTCFTDAVHNIIIMGTPYIPSAGFRPTWSLMP